MCTFFLDRKVMIIKEKIRVVPDFPTPGIQFYDITTLLNDAAAFRETIDQMMQIAKKYNPDVVVALESRGFFFGTCLALQLGVPFVPVRKKGKLPFKIRCHTGRRTRPIDIRTHQRIAFFIQHHAAYLRMRTDGQN